MNVLNLSRRGVLRLGAALLMAGPPLLIGVARAAPLPSVAVWKDAGCSCCEAWIRHMRQAGFSVMANNSSDMPAVKQARGVPDSMWSCHTAVVDGYVIEGHVPAGDVKRLLSERPAGKGLAVPGMPLSAPGMDQPGEPYSVMLFGDLGGEMTYARH